MPPSPSLWHTRLCPRRLLRAPPVVSPPPRYSLPLNSQTYHTTTTAGANGDANGHGNGNDSRKEMTNEDWARADAQPKPENGVGRDDEDNVEDERASLTKPGSTRPQFTETRAKTRATKR